MGQTIHVDYRDAAGTAVARKAFPSYSGRSFKVSVHDAGGMSLTSYWDGGSRDYYVIVRLSDSKQLPIPQNGTPFDPYGYGIEMPLPAPDFAVVEHSIFCGKDMGLTVHVHAENAAKLIPAPVDLTWAEKVVLVATCSLKSSHMGRTRAQMAERECGISQASWDAAKATLQGRRFLNAAGAVTVEGRNARPSRDLYWLGQERKGVA